MKGTGFQKIIDKRSGDCVGVMKGTFPMQEWFFIDPEPVEVVDPDTLTVSETHKPVDFLQLDYVDITRGEYDALLAMHHETDSLFIR